LTMHAGHKRQRRLGRSGLVDEQPDHQPNANADSNLHAGADRYAYGDPNAQSDAYANGVVDAD